MRPSLSIPITLTGFFLSMPLFTTPTLAREPFYQTKYCKKYFSLYEKKFQLPTNILNVISLKESGRWNKHIHRKVVWPWVINVRRKSYYFNSKYKAIRAVKYWKKNGVNSVDVGCMQINLKYHPDAFKSLYQAFSPRYNIEYSAKYLRQHYDRSNSWPKSIARYHNNNEKIGQRYLNDVYAHWKMEDPSFDPKSIQQIFIPPTKKRPDIISYNPLPKPLTLY